MDRHSPTAISEQPSSRAPLLVAILVNCAILGGLYLNTVRVLGRFVYPLDDAYIHMGMAQTLATTGTWGINPGEVASASSSPLWTLLLASSFVVAGQRHLMALLLNAVVSVVVVWLADRNLRRAGTPERAMMPALLAVVLATPIPFIAGLGMEHTLQVALTLAFAEAALTLAEVQPRRRDLVTAGLLAAAATFTRYEMVFLVGWACVLLMSWRRPWAALGVAIAGAIPVLSYAAWSTAHGAFPVPNSILMKSAYIGGWFVGARNNLTQGAPVWFLIFAALGLQLGERGLDRRVVLFVATAVTHLCLARIGWLYRYEAWLIAWGMVVVAPLAARTVVSHLRSGSRGAPALFLVVAVLPYGSRFWETLDAYAPAATWNYDSDVQMATYVRRYWPDSVIALHDIGAVSWYSDAEIVDVAGLATTEVTRLHVENRLSGETIGALLTRRKVEIAWTESRWLADDLPDGFSKVAEIHIEIPNSTETWSAVVWAVDPAARKRLVETLSEYRADLSDRVRIVLVDEVDVPLAQIAREGSATELESGRIAFYANGRALLVSPTDGTLVVMAGGSDAEGRGPRFAIRVGDRVVAHQAGERIREFDVGPVHVGDAVTVDYQDDLVDRAGNDRNLWITRVVVRP